MATGVVETLLVEISARSVELEARLASAEAKLSAFESHAKKTGDESAKGFLRVKTGIEPVTIALTAVGAMMLATGVKALQMGAQTNGALRQISAASPGVGRNLGAIRDEVEGVADATGRAREEIFAATEQISRLGVASVAELKAKLDASTLIADATGTQLQTAVDGVDQLADAFDLSSDQIVDGVAKLASAARGRVDFDSLFGAFTAATPRIQKLGLDFETSVRATVALLDQGLSAKKVAAFFNDHDAAAIREVGKAAKISAGALKELEDAAAFRRAGGDREMQRAINQFNGALTDLGTRILPTAIAGMRELVSIIDFWTGRQAKVDGQKSVDAILAQGVKRKLDGAGLDDLRAGMGSIIGGGGLQGSITAGKAGELSTDELRSLSGGMQVMLALRKEAKLTTDQVANLTSNIGVINSALQARDRLEAAAPDPSHPTVGGRKALPKSEEEKAKAAEAAKKARADVEEIRQIFAEISVAGEASAVKATKSAFDDALASIDKFLEQARQKRAKLVELLDGQVKSGAISGGSRDAQLDAFGQRMFDEFGRLGAAADAVRRKERDAVTNDVAQTLAAMTGDARAALEAIDAAFLTKKKEEGWSAEQIAQLEKVQASVRATTLLGKDVDKALAGIAASAANGMAPMQQMRALTAEETRLLERQSVLKKDATGHTAELEDIEKRLKEIEGKRTDLADKQTQYLQEQVDAGSRLHQTTHAVAEGINLAADAAYGLVQVLGQGDTALGRLVTSAGQLANGIAKATGPGGFGALSALEKFSVAGSVIGGAIGIGQAFLGETPEEKARKQALQQNTEAIRELTMKAGLLGSVALSGSAVGSARDTAEKFAATGFLDQKHASDAERLVNMAGVRTNSAEFQRFVDAAKELGVTVDNTAESIAQGVRAILDAAGKLGEFGDDFQSFQAQAEAARKILGRENPAQVITDLATASAKASPALTALFEGLDLTKASDLETLRSRVQAFFHTMESGGEKLTPEQLGSLTGDQLIQYLESIISGIDALVPGVQSVAEKVSKAREDLNAEFEIMNTDAAHRLAMLEEAYGANGGALADLVNGLDPVANAGDIETLHARIQALFQQLQESPDSVDLAGLSIDQFIAALLDLNAGVQNAASGMESAAQKLAKAGDSLRTDFEVYGTDSVGQAEGLASLFSGVGGIGGALGGLDLKSASGRAAAIAALQDLYGSDKGNAEQTSAVLELLRSLRAIPDVGGETGGGGGASPQGDTSRVTDASRTITEQTGNRMADYLSSLLVATREIPERLASLLQQLGAARIPVPATAQYQFGAGATVYNITVRVQNTQIFNAPLTEAARGIVEEEGRAAARMIADDVDKKLGTGLRTARQLTGNPVVR